MLRAPTGFVVLPKYFQLASLNVRSVTLQAVLALRTGPANFPDQAVSTTKMRSIRHEEWPSWMTVEAI